MVRRIGPRRASRDGMRVLLFAVPEPPACVQEGQRREPEAQGDARGDAREIRHARLPARAAATVSPTITAAGT